MKIVRTQISNYRNLDGIEIHFTPTFNFIVGENNLGKSNFLDMLEVIFNKRGFEKEDFLRKDKPITVEITLMLDDTEKGIFDDLFDYKDNKNINIIARQETPEDILRYFHKESGIEISRQEIRCVNFIRYDSLRMPKDELTFYKNRGVGKFLGYLVEKILNENQYSNDSFIKKDLIESIINIINDNLSYIKPFEMFGINTKTEENLNDLILRLLCIKNQEGFDIQKLGYGVQFLLLIVLSILDKIMQLIEDERYNRGIFERYEKQEKIRGISLILGVDEPEIHLHPHMQRNLVKYIKNIISNEDDKFKKLLKTLFNLDEIYGQAIIVTHSPNIILDDYSEIIRFYQTPNKSIGVINGVNLELDYQSEKQLRLHMPYIKEALFSKCVLIVEGDSEFGAMPLWANKIIREIENRDIDEYGISFVNAGSKKSVKPIVNLMEHYNIPVIPIVDRDNGNNAHIINLQNLIITNFRDFEEEIVNKLLNENRDLLFKVLQKYDTNFLNFIIQKGKLKDIAKKYGIAIDWENKDYSFSDILDSNNINLVKAMFLAWFDIKKSIILGRHLGKEISSEYIPDPYKKAILKAMEVIKHA